MRLATILFIAMLLFGKTPIHAETLNHRVFPEQWNWTSVHDQTVVTEGTWVDDRFRFADEAHKYTIDHDATLKWNFTGKAVVVRLAGQNTSSYPGTGLPAHGKLSVFLDGKLVDVIYPAQHGREFIVANDLPEGIHELELKHSAAPNSAGVRIEGFLTAQEPVGLLAIAITGELQEYLNDVRLVVTKDNKIIRSSIERNWLTGNSTIALPAKQSYQLRIEALGWTTQTHKTPTIEANSANNSPPIYLHRDPKTKIYRFRSPQLNNQAIRKPGEQFTARFLGFDTQIKEVRIQRQNSEATFTRVLPFKENKEKAFYYDRQIEVSLPGNTPPGVYDLEIDIIGGRRTSTCRSPSSVVIVSEYPINPRFVTFGHLDTSGQFQAEYLKRITSMANIIGADMVLASNSVNPAYISGALSNLQMPYVVNFGNHQVFGHHRWYGSDLGGVSFGPDIFVLNYGLPWHEPIEPVLAKLEQNRAKSIKVINAFEHNAPTSLLDDFKIALIHDAHGPGDKLMKMGNTPTQRVGKSNSISFRVVEFQNGKVINATYNGHPTAPIPFTREQESPLRINWKTPTEANVINDFEQAFKNAKVTFLVPKATYTTATGRIESTVFSDDGRFAEVTVAVDLNASSKTTITLLPE